MIRGALAHLVGWTAPLVRRIARAYGIRLDSARTAHGQNPLIFEDTFEDVKNNVPASVYFNTRSGQISVGSAAGFGENVMVLTGKHFGYDEAQRNGLPFHYVPSVGRDIIIGKGAYIGSGAILIGPLTIGDHAMIGAGAVVTKDVPPHAFVAGNPARLIKMLNH
jgi:acetyltransferase-like isoleucine patch superfamily enzyme